jgi:hypothetical protein
MTMTDFIIKKLPYDLSSQAGLALVGKYLRRINLNALVDPLFPVRSGVSNSTVLKSYLALLCQGKSDFDAIEAYRDATRGADAFFMRALGLSAVPSSPTLRQRLDAQASAWFDLASTINTAVLSLRIDGHPVAFGALPCGYTPIDIDTFAMDNSGTAKELVGRTYAGVDGYCPLAAYLGTTGFCLELALRPGSQHSASESQYNFERLLPMATSLVSTPLLVRMDSGFCSAALMQEIATQAHTLDREVAFIIKWNPRTTPVESIAQGKVADVSTPWVSLRAGKRECLWQEPISVQGVPGLRRIYRLTERTIDKRGHPLLLPEFVLEGWSTTLPEQFEPEQIIALYAQHATHEQFHAEFKTDMGLQRLPSGKFDTNYLICQLAAVAMNVLRLIGVHTLHDGDGPVRHSAQRRRIKTVIQEMIYKAGRMMAHAGQWILGLGQNDKAFTAFERHYKQMRPA